jgi:hypothetical protein
MRTQILRELRGMAYEELSGRVESYLIEDS